MYKSLNPSPKRDKIPSKQDLLGQILTIQDNIQSDREDVDSSSDELVICV